MKAANQDLQSACSSSATCEIIPLRSCKAEFEVKAQWRQREGEKDRGTELESEDESPLNENGKKKRHRK